jgi:hypothetical protein
MGDRSLSFMKYQLLGQKVTQAAIGDIIFARVQELPKLIDNSGNGFALDSQHDLNENAVQTMLYQAFVGQRIGAGFYVCDTHKTQTFLGADMMPDLIVSSIQCDEILGEHQVAFMIELKAGNISPCCPTCLGQAAAYGTRLLELSSALFRRSAIVVVTNLTKAGVVQVTRSDSGFQYKYAETSASRALGIVFSASRISLGMLDESTSYPVGDRTYILTNYLGSGASACVYGTACGNVAKFYSCFDGINTLVRERNNLNLLNNSLSALGDEFDFSVQKVVDSNEIECAYPFLILSPIGTVIQSQECEYYNCSALLKVLQSIKFAHIKCNLLHLDIRPANFIRLSNGDWMLIDWAAAQRCDPTDENYSKVTHTVLCEYTGCVTTAADSILVALAQAPIVEGNTMRVPVSRATDCISLLRTVFLLTTHISQKERSQLTECRNSADFMGIVRWWEEHLPPFYLKFENTLNEMLVSDGDVYDAMEAFILENTSPVL